MLHRLSRLTVVAIAVAVVALIAAGCSTDSSDDGSTSTTSTSAVAVDTSVRHDTIEVDSPVQGMLTFEALVAGDPAAAEDGRLVLLLHGFPETGEAYRDMLTPLAEAGYYAVAPDQRGYSPGARPPDVESYAMTELVADTIGMAEAVGADDFHLVGHDWGGAVAWSTAALVPEAVTTLTVLSTPHPDAIAAALSGPDSGQEEAFSYQEFFRSPGAEDRMLAEGPQSFINLFGASGIPTDELEAYAEVLGTPDALGAALNWYRANALDTGPALGPVTVPTLYVFGTDDGAFVVDTARATEEYVSGPYVYEELAGEGHWLPEVVPDELTALLLAQLELGAA